MPKFPKAAPYIVATETAERFSFYGMKAILTTFLVSNFFNPTNNPALKQEADAHGNEVTHLFVALVYLMSVLGGLLADYVIGRYYTILILSIIYCIGHAFLAIFETNYELFFTGLVLIAIGAGGVKPNVSVMVGEQFDNENDPAIPRLYNIFYFGINLGAFFSTLITPALKESRFGAPLAFGVPGLLMLLSLIIFIAGTKHYKIKKAADNRKASSGTFWQNIKSIWEVILVFSFIPVFWALYDQSGSEWVLQAGKMNLEFLGITWLQEQIQMINPILILTLIPVFTWGVYPAMEKYGIRVTALRKFGWGLALMVVTFTLIAWIQTQIDRGVQLNIGWQLLAYFILTVAEVFVSITGLEYAFSRAPRSLRSTVMAMFFLTVFIGNLLVAVVNNNIREGGFFSRFTGADYFWLFTAIMAVNTLLYYISIKIFKVKDTDDVAA
ncbi:MAG: MFS transporter [Chitinophagales bacterium]|nr:MFS transporter [Chitinophagales bacterium]MDW8419959.1 MFS transporter [Chitinophagales bacterium]